MAAACARLKGMDSYAGTKRTRAEAEESEGSPCTLRQREAGLCIVVTEEYARTWLVDGNWKWEKEQWWWSPSECPTPPLDEGPLGPLRLRVTGNVWALGCPERGSDDGWDDDGDDSWDDGRDWDPQGGVDLFWEGGHWTSLVIPVPPRRAIRFRVCRLMQENAIPGLLQGMERLYVHEARNFGWAWEYTVQSPGVGEVVQATLRIEKCAAGDWSADAVHSCLSWSVMCRQQVVSNPSTADPFRLSGADGALRHPGGKHRLYLFDATNGVSIKSSLYLPPGYHESLKSGQQWPLLIFLHSMHNRVDGDNNLFYESDTPLNLLLGDDERCPEALRQRFVVLAPECPDDRDRPQGSGIWLRHGWFETSTYAVEVERGLAQLVEATLTGVHVDRRRVCLTGASMGAYASLELASRWPGVFAAVAPVAAHYDLDPVEDLVESLTSKQALPIWFFHATNDGMCPYQEVADLVAQLRAKSKAEVRLSSVDDTWSNHGHCMDRVSYWACPRPGESGYPTGGDELFEWLAAQAGPGRAITPTPATGESGVNKGRRGEDEWQSRQTDLPR